MIYSRARLVIFVDGCFWHGCPECGDGRSPSSNTGYWSAKRRANRERDARRTRELEAAGWRVVRLWEHQVMKAPETCVLIIERLLLGGNRAE